MLENKMTTVLGVAGLSSVLSLGLNELKPPTRPESDRAAQVHQIDDTSDEIHQLIDLDRVQRAEYFQQLRQINRDIHRHATAATEAAEDSIELQQLSQQLSRTADQLLKQIEVTQMASEAESTNVTSLRGLVKEHQKTVKELKESNTALGKSIKAVSAELDSLRNTLEGRQSATDIVGAMRDIVRQRKDEYCAHAQANARKKTETGRPAAGTYKTSSNKQR